jgi:hypothetical protein
MVDGDRRAEGVEHLRPPRATLPRRMPSAPEDYEALPFPPGSSPFRIKGVAYRGHVDYAASFIPGGERAVIEGFRDAARAFREEDLPQG